jgi:hypothetical protein
MRSAGLPALLAVLWLLAGDVAAAGAAPPRRHGPACTPAGCPGPASPSAASGAAGFAAAALAAGALARRRASTRR